MKTYTAHRLTDAQLRRLSTIVNVGMGPTAGTAGEALRRKGLITDWRGEVDHFPRATETGRAALELARLEGW